MRLRKIAALALAGLALAGCASANTNSDQVAVVYDAGSFGEDTVFNDCQGNNLNEYYDPGSLVYLYPRGQRTYEFSNAEDAEQPPITIVSRDGVEMTVAGLLPFTLATDCETLRKFHERIGLQYGANGQDLPTEWVPLLRKYLGGPLTSVMISTAVNYDWRMLRDDQATRDQWFAQIIEQLPRRVDQLAGGNYFGNEFSLEIPAVVPPSELRDQIREQQVQAERVATINAQATAQAAEINQMRQLVDLLGPEGYILYRNQVRCETEDAHGCVPYLPLPTGSDVVVQPGG